MQDFQDILGALYLAVLFLGIINAMSVQSIVFFERAVSPCWRFLPLDQVKSRSRACTRHAGWQVHAACIEQG